MVVAAEVVDSVVMRDGEIDVERINPILHITKDRFAVGFKVVKHKRYD